jgi:hypothetical protein
MKKIREDISIGVIILTYMKISQRNSLCSYLYLKLKCRVFSFYLIFFFLLQNQRTEAWNKFCPVERAGNSGRGEVMGKRGMSTV